MARLAARVRSVNGSKRAVELRVHLGPGQPGAQHVGGGTGVGRQDLAPLVGDPDQPDVGILALEAEDGGARQARDQDGFADICGEARLITGRASSDNTMARRARRASSRIRRHQPLLTCFGLIDALGRGPALRAAVRGRPLYRPALLDGGLQVHDDPLHAGLRDGPAARRAQHAAAVVFGDHTAVPGSAVRVGGSGGPVEPPTQGDRRGGASRSSLPCCSFRCSRRGRTR